MSDIYDIPILWQYIMVVFLVIVVSIIGLYLFRKIDLKQFECVEQNRIVAIFIGIMASFLGITLSFLIVTSWDAYKTASAENKKEAESIFILYEVVSTLPGTENTQKLIIDYLKYIINVEFPTVRTGVESNVGKLYVQAIQKELYNYVPETSQETVLYQQSITLINVIINFRINRIMVMEEGVNNLIWWVAIIDATLLTLMCWILTCNNKFHYVLVVILAIYISTALFTIQVLSNPYARSIGITSEPFQQALNDILITYEVKK